MQDLKRRFYAIAPHLITLTALFAGMTALRFVLEGRTNEAVIALLVAAFLDGFDGFVARKLSGETLFGAHLDNLADFLSFGVAPAVFLYSWALDILGPLGWACGLIYAGGAAIRLARFGAAWQPAGTGPKPNFTGLPTPAAAIAVLLPWAMSHAVPLHPGWLLAGTIACVLLVPLLMVSRCSLPSAGRLITLLNERVPGLTILLIFWIVAGLVLAPFATLAMAGLSILLFATWSLLTSATLASPLRGEGWRPD